MGVERRALGPFFLNLLGPPLVWTSSIKPDITTHFSEVSGGTDEFDEFEFVLR